MFRGTIDQRIGVSARGGEGGTAAQRGGGHLFAQSSERESRAEPGRQGADPALKEALALVDVRTLDHIVVAGGTTTSFAERGLI
jgi:DNA repair protein RadC